MSAGSNEGSMVSEIMADARRLQGQHGAGMIAAVIRRLRLTPTSPAHSHLTAAVGALRLY